MMAWAVALLVLGLAGCAGVIAYAVRLRRRFDAARREMQSLGELAQQLQRVLARFDSSRTD